MKIILVAPKSISEHKQGKPFRLDYAYWNFYLPLLELGHQVKFFDTSELGNEHLRDLIKQFTPDLLFCIMTGSSFYCPDEPWQVIEEETKKGNILTFNWFCDDSWRFDSWSKFQCNKFNYCSTPELRFVQNYKKIGYSNIIYSTWHANHNVYSINKPKLHLVSFVGRIDSHRIPYIKHLSSINIDINIPKNISFEDLVDTYNGSLIGLNFSKNSTGAGTQIKARVFEIPACNSLLISEFSDEIQNNFEINKEVLCFSNPEQLEECFKKLKNENIFHNLVKNGIERFKKEHTSEKRLSKLLQQIK